MQAHLFPYLHIPDFNEVTMKSNEIISTGTLYSTARELFKPILYNFNLDQKTKKQFRNRSSYANFLKEYCKGKSSSKILKFAKDE